VWGFFSRVYVYIKSLHTMQIYVRL